MAKPRIKPDEIAHKAMRKTDEAARRADETAHMSQRIADRARLDTEIRFAKRNFLPSERHLWRFSVQYSPLGDRWNVSIRYGRPSE